MSILNKLPLTTFQLPSGETIESRNILKTIVFSKETKQNPNILKKIFSVNTSKIENVSYDFYSDNSALYWLTMHLNDIDSFENAPLPQSKFQSNLVKRFPGMVYYIYQARNPKFILPGDLIQLQTGAANATFTFGETEFDDAVDVTLTLIDSNGISKTYRIKASGAIASDGEFNRGTDAATTASNFKDIVESSDGHNGSISVLINTRKDGVVLLVQEILGTGGNTSVSQFNWNTICSKNPPVSFSGGSDEDWKNAGIVKEYDEGFRRIVLEREVINETNAVELVRNPTIRIYRKTGDTWNEISEVDDDGDSTGTIFKLGIKENEIDKILGFYKPNLNGELLSPFRLITGGGDSVSNDARDFSDTPGPDVVLNVYSDTGNAFNSIFNNLGLYKHTLKNEEIRKNTQTNTLSFFELGRAYEVTTFVNTLLGGSFKRGQSINVNG